MSQAVYVCSLHLWAEVEKCGLILKLLLQTSPELIKKTVFWTT